MDETVTPNLYRENLWLRQLIRTVAEDLERVALQESYGPHVKPLQARAMRIRRRLWEGPPEEWSSDR